VQRPTLGAANAVAIHPKRSHWLQAKGTVLRRALEPIPDTKILLHLSSLPGKRVQGRTARSCYPITVGLVLVSCELYVVECRKNRLDILEGHFSNIETRATDKPIPAGKDRKVQGKVRR
jgi:hypothetical protein